MERISVETAQASMLQKVRLRPDGSVGTIHYLANSASAVENEYLEVFGDLKTARMWNFEKLECAVGQKQSTTLFSGDKGHAEGMRALLDGFESGAGSPHQH
jgi:hypothetical protein